MSILLLGDSTEYPAGTDGAAADGWERAFQYVAVASGTLQQIDLFAIGHPTGGGGALGSDYTTLSLAIYADNSGAPGALLGYGTAAPPSWTTATSDWVSATGLSVPVTAGTAYWLAINPHGGEAAFNWTSGSGGAWDSDDGGHAAPADPYPATDPGNYFTQAVGLRGMGELSDPPGIGLVPEASQPGFFRIKLTTLHYPANTLADVPVDAQPVRTLARLEDFSDAEVVIPINDARTANVTISIDDPAAAYVKPYQTLLHIVYVTPTDAHLVFWGIVTQPEWSSSNETVKINAVDMSLRLQHHYVGYGDRILNGSDTSGSITVNGVSEARLPNPHNGTGWKRSTGKVPLDHIGLRMFIEAANNHPYQDARGVPPLGIRYGSNNVTALPDDTPHFMEVDRGRECWESMKDLNSHGAHADFPGAPDFELAPTDRHEGYYANLNTYQRQGNPDPSRLVFHDGFGEDNCLIDYTPGGTLVNVAYVLASNNQLRVTRFDADSTGLYGIYAQWDSTEIPAAATTSLLEYGQQVLDAYSEPPDYFKTAPNPDIGLYYKDHINVGDAMTATVRRGYLVRQMTADIVSVTLKQIDTSGNVGLELDSRVIVGALTEDGPPEVHS